MYGDHIYDQKLLFYNFVFVFTKLQEERENKRQEKIRQKLEGETLSSIDVKIEYKDTPSEQMPSLNTTEAMEKYQNDNKP